MSKQGTTSDLSQMSRREFFKVAFGVITGLLAAMMSWPLFSFLLNSKEKEDGEKFVKVPNFKSVAVGKPTKLTFQYIEDQGFIRQNMFYDVWIIKSSPSE